jgi:hypothetical protein
MCLILLDIFIVIEIELIDSLFMMEDRFELIVILIGLEDGMRE